MLAFFHHVLFLLPPSWFSHDIHHWLLCWLLMGIVGCSFIKDPHYTSEEINHLSILYLYVLMLWTPYQWEFQDPKMEVLYHIRPYFVGIFPYIGLIYGRYLQFRFLKWPLIYVLMLWWLQPIVRTCWGQQVNLYDAYIQMMHIHDMWWKKVVIFHCILITSPLKCITLL